MTRWGASRVLRPSRFGNRPTACRAWGLHHHSGMEAARCDELDAMQRGGLVSDVQAHPQPKFQLDRRGKRWREGARHVAALVLWVWLR